MSQREVIDGLLKRMEEKMLAPDVKVTLADYIRLLQLKKELEEDEPKEIVVRWEKEEDESGEI